MSAAAPTTLTAAVVVPETSRVLAAVPVWWARRARLAGLPPDWQDWRRALQPPPVPLDVDPAPGLGAVSGSALGEAYVHALPSVERLRWGSFYTPSRLADALWQEVERARLPDVAAGPIVDPACGAGSLLLRPVRAFVQAKLRDSSPDSRAVGDVVAGVDRDPLAVWLGNAVLGAELLPLWARQPESQRGPLPSLLRVGDGLASPPEAAKLVVMNPPFGRAALSAAERERWTPILYGHANYYAMFLQAAVEHAQTGGAVAAILPTSFLGGAYYQRLRAFLAEQAPLTRLRLIDDRSGVFAAGVLQGTCLAVFHKGAKRAPVTCSTQRVNGTVSSVHLGGARLSDWPERPWLIPRAREDRALVRRAAKLPHRLSDYGWSVSTGPLVWNRHRAQIAAEPTGDARPILWASDVEPGRVRRSAARATQRWIELRERDAFMVLAEPAVLVQRTTAPEQPRRLVAAPLTARQIERNWSGGPVVENHVNVLRRSDRAEALSPALLAALLGCETIDRLYRCMTGTVAVSAYELEEMPLPPLDVVASWEGLDAAALEQAVAEVYAA